MDMFFTFLQKLRARGSTPAHSLLTVELSRAALIHNFNTIQQVTGWHISPVLKSNAYGHGLVEIGSMLEQAQNAGTLTDTIPFISVDSYFEALTLRKAGIRLPILVIGYTPTETLRIARLPNVTYAITSHDQVNELANDGALPHISVHLKIDTGMHRQGIRADEIPAALKTLRAAANIQVTGAYSHFADSDGDNDNKTLEQVRTWANAIKEIHAAYPNAKDFHIANTAGMAFVRKIKELAPATTCARLGLGLYGISTIPNNKRDDSIEHRAHKTLQPVLALYSEISGTKKLHTGETVGYNNTFIANKEMRCATLPAGYFEGLPRGLSNKGKIEVYDADRKSWVYAPFIGRISMNISTIDITDIPEAGLHTQVRLVSPHVGAPNSMECMAETANMIPHDAIVDIPAHLRRIIVNNHRP